MPQGLGPDYRVMLVDANGNPIGAGAGTPEEVGNHTWDPISQMWEEERSNYEELVIPAAARTATTNFAEFINYNGRGAWFFLNVTATPNNADQIQLAVQGKNNIAGQFRTIHLFPTLTASTINAGVATNPCFPYVMGPANTYQPGAAAGVPGWTLAPSGLSLPRHYRLSVVHLGSGGSWNYSCTASYTR